MFNVYANFDILYLLLNIKVKYSELNIYELNVMLYLSQLLSIYDGNSSNRWGYVFTNNEYGSPLSSEISLELSMLYENKRFVQNDNEFYSLTDNVGLEGFINNLSNQYRFQWRTKYIQCTIDCVMLKTLPQITEAVQNEPGIHQLKNLNRNSTLHDDSDKSIDVLFEDFKMLKSVVGDARNQIIVPASIWIEYLSSR